MKARSNPAWTNAILSQYWEPLVALVGTELMPGLKSSMERKGRTVVTAAEYGTGHYGTVMPTETLDVVFKLTSDPTEARFIANAMSLKESPTGIVRYYGVVQLPAAHRNRPVFAVWRQEAHEIGKVIPEAIRRGDAYDKSTVLRFERRLEVFKNAAHALHESYKASKDPVALVRQAAKRYESLDIGNADDFLERNSYERNDTLRKQIGFRRGVDRAAFVLAVARNTAESMGSEAFGTEVGDALDFYLRKGLLMADVHQNNLGLIDHPEYDDRVLAITDPGHVVSITDHYDSVKVPQLMDLRGVSWEKAITSASERK